MGFVCACVFNALNIYGNKYLYMHRNRGYLCRWRSLASSIEHRAMVNLQTEVQHKQFVGALGTWSLVEENQTVCAIEGKGVVCVCAWLCIFYELNSSLKSF